MEQTLSNTTAAARCHHLGGGEPICVRVSRCVEGLPEALFSFTGAVDAAVLRALLQQVERLVQSVPGGGHVEVIASALDAGVLQEARVALRDLQRRGFAASLASLCMPRAASIAVPSLSLH